MYIKMNGSDHPQGDRLWGSREALGEKVLTDIVSYIYTHARTHGMKVYG